MESAKRGRKVTHNFHTRTGLLYVRCERHVRLTFHKLSVVLVSLSTGIIKANNTSSPTLYSRIINIFGIPTFFYDLFYGIRRELFYLYVLFLTHKHVPTL